MLAYVLPDVGVSRFALSGALAALALFFVGAARAFFTRRSAVKSGLEMLTLGVAAGAIAYGAGWFGAWIVGTEGTL